MYAYDRKLSSRVVYFILKIRLKLNTNEFPSLLVLVSSVNIANEKMQFEEEKDRIDSDRSFCSIVVRDRIAVGGRREKRFLLSVLIGKTSCFVFSRGGFLPVPVSVLGG